MPTRRALLAAALASGVAGCLARRGPARRRPDPDEAVRARAAAGEGVLLAAYDAVLSARPDLAGRLSPLRAEHAAHLAALGTPAAASPTAPARPAVAPHGADLVAAERRASVERLADCLAASDPALARLLASIGACEAVHVIAAGAVDR